MIASGAGWPAGGSGLGAYGTTRARDRAGDAADPASGGIRPVTPSDGAGERAWRGPDERAAAGPAETGPQPVEAQAHDGPPDRAGGGALVPVGGPSDPAAPPGTAHPGASAAAAPVPVASAPSLSAPIAPAAAFTVQVAVTRMAAGAGPGTALALPAWGVAVDGERPAGAPAEAAAASRAYRARGALPPMGIGAGRILRASI